MALLALAERARAPEYGDEAPEAVGRKGAVVVPFPRLSLREEELVQLWEGQRFPKDALRTRAGGLIRVVYRGRRSPGPGPDFADAVIADEQGCLLRGDIELHVRAGAFRGHGHHLDHRYDNLVLHVVFEDDEGEGTRLASGRTVQVVALAPWVARRAAQLRAWLAQPALWVEPCLGAVAGRGEEEVAATVFRLGRMRFRQKQAAYAGALEGESADQVLYEGILRALGERLNADAFAALARRVPYERLRATLAGEGGERKAESALLEAVGLLPGGEGAVPRPGPCVTVGLRPANHPARRLAGAVRLLGRLGPGLREGLEQTLAEASAGPLERLAGGWQVPSPGSGTALIGRGRALELLVNVALPFSAAWGESSGRPDLVERAMALYERLPRPGSYGVIRMLERSLGSVSQGKGGACFRQGLLYLHHEYCSRGGCGACPLSPEGSP